MVLHCAANEIFEIFLISKAHWDGKVKNGDPSATGQSITTIFSDIKFFNFIIDWPNTVLSSDDNCYPCLALQKKTIFFAVHGEWAI